MSEKFFNSLPSKFRSNYSDAKYTHVSGVGGEKHKILGRVNLKFQIDDYEYIQSFHIFQHLHHHVIIGNDFLLQHDAVITSGKSLQLSNGVQVNLTGINDKLGLVRPIRPMEIPACSEMDIEVRVSCPNSDSYIFIEPTNTFKKTHHKECE